MLIRGRQRASQWGHAPALVVRSCPRSVNSWSVKRVVTGSGGSSAAASPEAHRCGGAQSRTTPSPAGAKERIDRGRVGDRRRHHVHTEPSALEHRPSRFERASESRPWWRCRPSGQRSPCCRCPSPPRSLRLPTRVAGAPSEDPGRRPAMGRTQSMRGRRHNFLERRDTRASMRL